MKPLLKVPKPLLIGSLILSQLPMAPVAAARIEDHAAVGAQQPGTFAGARFRVPFGGKRAGRPSLGLGIAGLAEGRSADGRLATQFAEGVEIGFAADRRLGLSIGGQAISRQKVAAQETTEAEDDDGGLSTWETVGLVAGGVLIAAGIGLALFVDAVNDASD